ncbi:MAG: DUF86 domain-containing protein [Gammaproteobacteria bacterium]|nr:MAG: DUF86 domain-containing protein [Gammaproteobacteria bacterium]
MKPSERDAAHLWDMLDTARRAQELAAGVSYDALMADIRTRYALERALEIIGEAARRVSPTLRAKHPEIPWKGILGFRNVLAHEYGEIDYRRLHTIATEKIPALISALQQILGEQPAT